MCIINSFCYGDYIKKHNMGDTSGTHGEEKCAARIPFGTVILNAVKYGIIKNYRQESSHTVQMIFLTVQDTLHFYGLHNTLT
jgi:hypothetical protein